MRRTGSSDGGVCGSVVAGADRRRSASAMNDWRLIVGDGFVGCAKVGERAALVMISRERNVYARIITRPPVKNYIHQQTHHNSTMASIEDQTLQARYNTERRVHKSANTTSIGSRWIHQAQPSGATQGWDWTIHRLHVRWASP